MAFTRKLAPGRLVARYYDPRFGRFHEPDPLPDVVEQARVRAVAAFSYEALAAAPAGWTGPEFEARESKFAEIVSAAWLNNKLRPMDWAREEIAPDESTGSGVGNQAGRSARKETAERGAKPFTGHAKGSPTLPEVVPAITTPPPSQAFGSDPSVWNLYSYVASNPLTRTDPDGREWYYDKKARDEALQKASKGSAPGYWPAPQWVDPDDKAKKKEFEERGLVAFKPSEKEPELKRQVNSELTAYYGEGKEGPYAFEVFKAGAESMTAQIVEAAVDVQTGGSKRLVQKAVRVILGKQSGWSAWGETVEDQILNAAKAQRKARKQATPVREGIYQFPDQRAQGTPYVGQSENIPQRLEQHQSVGRLQPGTETTAPVTGGKTAREIAEHNRIQQLTGGQKAKNSPAVSNVRDPIGAKRRPGLGLPEPRD
ncbi:MAG: hypothetical protein ACE15E_25080 [Acidobacteriota bacterium]